MSSNKAFYRKIAVFSLLVLSVNFGYLSYNVHQFNTRHAVELKRSPFGSVEERIFTDIGMSRRRFVGLQKLPIKYHPRHPFVIDASSTCMGEDVFLLVYVHSASKHLHRRNSIRKTWGNTTYWGKAFNTTTRVVFVLGKAEEDSQDISRIAEESSQYGDIVLVDYIDTYRNLTHKALSALRWIQTYCRQARFVLKADDDVLVNNVAVLNDMMEWERQGSMSLIGCLNIGPATVQRNGKWMVPKEIYPEKLWPRYCHGAFFFCSTEVAMALLEVSKYNPFVWVDDAFITGILRNRIGVDIYNSTKGFLNNAEFDHMLERASLDKSMDRILNTWYIYDRVYNIEKHVKLWNKLVEGLLGLIK